MKLGDDVSTEVHLWEKKMQHFVWDLNNGGGGVCTCQTVQWKALHFPLSLALKINLL